MSLGRDLLFSFQDALFSEALPITIATVRAEKQGIGALTAWTVRWRLRGD